MTKKIYELWFNKNEATLFDEENVNIKSHSKEDMMIVKFEASSINEAIIKMNELLKIFNKNENR